MTIKPAVSYFIVILLVGGCTGADVGKANGAPSAVVTGPATVTTTVTETVDVPVTVTRTVDVPVTITVTETTEVVGDPPAALSGPQVVTDEYIRELQARGAPDDQWGIVVDAVLENQILTVLTTMDYPYGGWNCSWEPVEIAGQNLRYIQILWSDHRPFRTCGGG